MWPRTRAKCTGEGGIPVAPIATFHSQQLRCRWTWGRAGDSVNLSREALRMGEVDHPGRTCGPSMGLQQQQGYVSCHGAESTKDRAHSSMANMTTQPGPGGTRFSACTLSLLGKAVPSSSQRAAAAFQSPLQACAKKAKAFSDSPAVFLLQLLGQHWDPRMGLPWLGSVSLLQML